MRKLHWILVFIISVGICRADRKKSLSFSLVERFQRLSCAVVQITSDQGGGTGFFISPDGDIVTAAHVAVDRTFSEPEPGKIKLAADYKQGLRIHRHGGYSTDLNNLPKISDADNERALSDLFILRSGIKTPCFLRIGRETKDLSVGQHLIAMGYPESAPDGVLYEGILSATYRHLPIPIAVIDGKPLFPEYNVVRIQMPITPGVSGAPVIADDDDVIAVITENPAVWFGDLTGLIGYGQHVDGGFNAPVSDLPKMLAKLAWVVHDYVSSGAGLAVPISYLETKKGQKK
jgi:S1-C subfamily serine protease